MDRVRHLRNYNLHSWTGLVLGLIVYVVSLTGAFALFDDEIKTWEDPTLRVAVSENLPAMNTTYLDWVQETAGDAEREFMRFDFPTDHAPYFQGMVQYYDANDEHVFERQRWDANTGERIQERGAGLSVWLLDFHRDFMWPDGLGGRTVGRSLVGIVGIILMLALLSGIIAHTKIREEAYSMRLKRSQRLKWQDSHKVIGLWGLPFYVMIAFTGAFLGVVVIVSQLVAAIAFKGDVDALVGQVLGPEKVATGEQAQMLTIEEIYAMRHPESGAHPNLVLLNNYGDSAAEFDIFYPEGAALASSDIIAVKGSTGEEITDDPFREITPALRVTNAITPLHYGTFGGIWLKLLYFILGLSLAVITALGSMMWIERRKHGNEGTKSQAFYNRLGHISTGVIMGLPVATMAIFYLDKLYGGAEAARLAATGLTYFSVWALGLVYAFARRNDYATTRELVMLTGALAMGIPVLNGLATGDWFFASLTAEHTAAARVDALLLIGGLITLMIAFVLPAKRREKQKVEKQSIEAKVAGAIMPAE